MWGRGFWGRTYWAEEYWPTGVAVQAPAPPAEVGPAPGRTITKKKRRRFRAEPEPIQRERFKDQFLQLGREPEKTPAPSPPAEVPQLAVAASPVVPAEAPGAVPAMVPVQWPRRKRAGVATVGDAAFVAAHPPVEFASSAEDDDELELVTALARALW